MKRCFLAFALALTWSSGQATNLTLSKPILYLENGVPYTVFNLSWDNAWHHERNHDAAWLFFKLWSVNGDRQHIKVLKDGHAVVSTFATTGLKLAFKTSEDGVGLFVLPESKYRGKVEAIVKVMLDPASFEGVDTRSVFFDAYGIEMVHIPEGAFEVGYPGEKAAPYGSIYQPGKNGTLAGTVKITAEDQELLIAENGDLFYQAKRGYEGDQTGKIPAQYPKGVAPFYMMKYEVTEGQYVDFLNSLNQTEITARAITQAENYQAYGGSIEDKEYKFFTPFPDKPCKLTSWDDAMAYADWAGLRPMTELEFTKAARGPQPAQLGDFPWGTTDKTKMQRLPNANGELVMNNGWLEATLSDETKAFFGASFYWVMDLSGSLWERMITIGHPDGRAFTGTHGDGVLSAGSANETWPTGETQGGVGYRGGGFYGYTRAYHEYNPFSPISYRPYGGWHGTERNIAYGTRFVRSTD